MLLRLPLYPGHRPRSGGGIQRKDFQRVVDGPLRPERAPEERRRVNPKLAELVITPASQLPSKAVAPRLGPAPSPNGYVRPKRRRRPFKAQGLKRPLHLPRQPSQLRRCQTNPQNPRPAGVRKDPQAPWQ